MKKTKRSLALFLSLVMCITYMIIPVSGASLEGVSKKAKLRVEKSVQPIISVELQEIVEDADENEMIPIYIFRELIPNEDIDRKLIEETGMDSDIYEDAELFESIVIPQITKSVEEKLGFEKAREVDSETLLSAVDVEINAEADRFLEAKRSIVKREYIKANKEFTEKHVDNSRNIFYNSEYTSTIATEATPAEIREYAQMGGIEAIAYFEEYIDEPELDTVLNQIGADSSTGTKSTTYNSGSGYKGSGIKIGIIESGSGRYDSSAPHLTGLPSSRLSYVQNKKGENEYVTPTVTSHATIVTSLVVGKSVTLNSKTYEGVVPLATVYQTASENSTTVYTGFQALVDKGVNIINYSAGSNTSGYTAYDKEIDRLISTTNVSFIKSSGNNSGEITSPGKALNAITVGNAQTKTSSSVAASTPYKVYSTSCYTHASYLPNKPDIVAPGTNIRYASSSTATSYATGTSLSAPIVTGVLAQSMQRVSVLKTNPYYAKAFLLLCADSSKMLTDTNNSSYEDESVGNYLWEKSGAGLVNAKNLTLGYAGKSGTFTEEDAVNNSSTYSYTKGQKIRVVMVFGKKNTLSITARGNLDDIDLNLVNSSTGRVVDSSTSSTDNVEIIEYTIPTTGNYYFQAESYTIQDTAKGVPFAMFWRVIS